MIVDTTDTTKQLKFDAGGTASTSTTITAAQTANRVVTLPNATTTLVGTDTAQVITAKDIDGGTATDTSRITIPKATKTTLDALTRKEATLVYASDFDKLYVDNGTQLSEIGSGGGELNLVDNGSDAGSWTTTGAQGPTGATTSTAGDLPLAGTIDTALKLTSATAAGAEASHYIAYTLPVGAALQNRKLKIEFWMRPGTNFLSSEWSVSVYSGSTRMALSTDASGVTYLPNLTGKFSTSFDADSSSTYTLRFSRPVNAGSNAAVLNLAGIVVGPGIQPQGAVVEEWQSWTPTLSAGFGTTSGLVAYYRRVGTSLEARVRFTSGTHTGALGSISLPSGLTLNTAAIPLNTSASAASAGSQVGHFFANNAANSFGSVGGILAGTSTSTSLVYIGGGSAISTSTQGAGYFRNVNDYTSAIPFDIWFQVPIAEWAGSGTVNLAQNDVEYAYNTSTSTTASDTTSFGYGPSGALIQSITSALTRTVRFPTPIQPTDQLFVQVDPDGTGGWVTVPTLTDSTQRNIDVMTKHNTTTYGIGQPRSINGTDAKVDFGQYRSTADVVSFSGAGAAWSGVPSAKWRVVKTKAGVAVGFGVATETQNGLVKLPNGMVRANTGNGHGSTNTKIRRFTNFVSTGTAITAVDSATLGTSFTINEAGIYSISYTDSHSSSAEQMGISLNSANLTTSVFSLSAAERVIMTYAGVGGSPNNVGATIRLNSGDVIRPHTAGSLDSTANVVQFIITQVVKL